MKQTFLHLMLATLTIVALTALSAPAPAMAQGAGFTVGGFIDENGDGYNDLAPDADGDGIPNGLDPDYAPPLDGTGQRFGATGGSELLSAPADAFQHKFMNKFLNMWQRMFGQTITSQTGYGPGDGTGNDGVGPGDGTGYGRLGGLRQRGQI
ncbi:MAG: hypothetical protein ACYDIE_04705 [Candidatus Krumholzibacteriia bacterium]